MKDFYQIRKCRMYIMCRFNVKPHSHLMTTEWSSLSHYTTHMNEWKSHAYSFYSIYRFHYCLTSTLSLSLFFAHSHLLLYFLERHYVKHLNTITTCMAVGFILTRYMWNVYIFIIMHTEVDVFESLLMDCEYWSA